MDDQEFFPAEGSGTDAKKDLVRNIAKSGDKPLEDPSRATLHYGEESRPELGGDTGDQTRAFVTEPVVSENQAPASDTDDTTVNDRSNTGVPPVQFTPGNANASTITSEQNSAPAHVVLDQPTLPEFDLDQNAPAAPVTANPSKTDTPHVSRQSQEHENVAPTEIQLEGTEVAENAAGAVVGRLSVVDPNNADSHSFTVSDERFEIVDGEIRLRPGVVLDHEDAATIRLDVTATDRGGLSVTETFEITVLDVNEGPESISLDAASIAENAEGAVVGQISVVDPDSGDGHTYTVSDDRFEIVNGELRLKPGVSLDHEEAASITVDVTATDSGGLSISESFEISVEDVNEAPIGIELDSRTIVGGEDGAVVGRIAGTDPDAGDTLSFTVSDERFEIVDGDVRLRPGNTVSSEEGDLELVVTATDSGGLSTSETFTISVFDPPVISVESGFTAEYFDVDHSLKKMSDIDWDATPTHSEMTQDINYENGHGSFWSGGDTDTFGARVSGNIEVEEGGVFTFHLGGDDGAILFVNGKKIVDNDGEHGFRTRTGEVELPEGNHHIEVRYFENYGRAGLRLQWEGPGIDGPELVEASGSGAALGIEGVATPLNLNIGNVDSDAGYRLEGLPDGTLVQVSDAALTVGENGVVDLTGFDLTDLSITPPIGSAGAFLPNLVVAQVAPNGEIIEVSHPIEIDVTPAHLSTPDIEMFGGFHASYFDVDYSLSRLDQIDWDVTPTHEEIVTEVNYANSRGSFWEGGSTDTFGVRIEGDIEVTEGGQYEFFLGGDDGAVLYIDGRPVIDNDGLHGFRTRSSEVDLEPGSYNIEVRYFENHGHAGLKLEWQGPGTDGRELLTAKPDLEIEQNGSTQIAIDLGDPAATESVVIDGLPADTVLFIGDDTFVTDGGPLDVSGYDVSLMELSPPAGFVGTIKGEISTVSKGFNGQLTEGGTTFEMTVGGEGESRSAATKSDGSLTMIDGSQEEPNSDDWTQLEQPTNTDEGDPDDVLSEEISELQVPEAQGEHMDTYERYDW